MDAGWEILRHYCHGEKAVDHPEPEGHRSPWLVTTHDKLHINYGIIIIMPIRYSCIICGRTGGITRTEIDMVGVAAFIKTYLNYVIHEDLMENGLELLTRLLKCSSRI